MRRGVLSLIAVMMIPVMSSGQAGTLVKKAVKEIMEAAARKGATEGADTVAALGGEAVIREIIEKAASEGGEEVVQRVVFYGRAYGADSITAFRAAPLPLIKALDALPSELTGPALRAAAREPELISRLTVEYGDDALRAVINHPGIGAQMVDKLGRDGVEAALRMPTADAISLSRHLDEITQLPTQERQVFFSMLSKSPGKVIHFMEQHPKVFLMGAGAGGVYAMRDQIFGTGAITTIGPDGTVTTQGSGFVDRIWRDTLMMLKTPLSALLFAAAWVLCGWGGIKMLLAWRAGRAKLDKLSGD